jgi:hypothetical protein
MKAEEIADADAPSEIAKITNGNTVGVGCAEQCSNTGAHDRGNGYLLLNENFEDTQVSETPGESATQGKSDPRSTISSRDSARSQFSS